MGLGPETGDKGLKLLVGTRLGPRRPATGRQQNEAGERQNREYPEGLGETGRQPHAVRRGTISDVVKPESVHDFDPPVDD